ncbi:MAG: glycoside hydrolase family 16 protein [Ilumatobacteraceae bacterium]
MTGARTELDDSFADLDTDVWVTSYLPHWSSRADAAATWALAADGLHLSIPPDQPLWCPGSHDGPLRVSCIQSGNHSGPVGSTVGPQPFRDGLVVREEQPTTWGYTPCYGRVEATMRGIVTDRSMFAFWMSGIEDRPERSGEICVAEIFGDAIRGREAAVGMGIKAFRDPALVQDFAADPVLLDVTDLHTYGVDWRPGSLAFEIDGEVVRRLDQAPDYPCQLMIGVFDFPARATDGPTPVPEVVVTRVLGRPWSPTRPTR